MFKKSIKLIAEKHMPKIAVQGKNGWLRHNVIDSLEGDQNIGIELGVATGIFARRMINSGKFQRFYGVDVYGDTHDTKEYFKALEYIGFQNPKYCLLRMDFETAIDLFKDDFFNFIYIDGFAHTGEEGGKTLVDWYRKLKVGGILAGDDYHKDWPLVMWAVNDLANQLKMEVNITLGTEDAAYSKYPSWFITKKSQKENPKVNPKLFKIGMREKHRIHRLRTGKRRKLIRLVGKILEIIGLKQKVLKLLSHFR